MQPGLISGAARPCGSSGITYDGGGSWVCTAARPSFGTHHADSGRLLSVYGMPRGRSSLQKVHSMQNLARIRAEKENYDLVQDSASSSDSETESHEIKRGNNFQRRLHNETRKLKRAQSTRVVLEAASRADKATIQVQQSQLDGLAGVSLLVAELKERNAVLQREKNMYRMREARAPQKFEDALKTALTFHIKQNGVVTDNTRALVRDLVAIGVPSTHVGETIALTGRHLGVSVEGRVSERSISRIVLEGGVAATMQLGDEMTQVKGDGTSHRHIQYEVKHVTYTLPGASHPVTRTLSISSAPNHTSETQLQGWKDEFARITETVRNSPFLSKMLKSPISVSRLAALIVAMNSDHAEDQKKLGRLTKNWKLEAAQEVRGEDFLYSHVLADVMPVLCEEKEQELADAGGLDHWNKLSAAEKEQKNKETYHRICMRLGDEVYAGFSDEEKEIADLFIWMGCCMHKELNTVKGGNAAMMAYWEKNGLRGPILLMNKDNDAAAQAGPSAAKDRAEDVSQAGAVKATILAGAVFRHKDDKKGQQDTVRCFFEQKLGYAVRFPDTSNTCFQSYCRGSEELTVRKELWIELLEQIRDKKESRSFNHIEQNVYKALHDIPTLTEFAVLSLYSQSISCPYMRAVRGPGLASVNMLDLGPLHERVKTHCADIIANPDLLLSPDASYELGTMDGKPWERPEVFYAVQQAAASLPHLRGAMVAFFEGALETWHRFTTEFADEKMGCWQSEALSWLHINATNDGNKGKLGGFHVGMRRAPSMTLHQYNARLTYKMNETSTYMQSLSAQDLRYIRKVARRIDSGGLEKKRTRELADADEEVVREKRRKMDIQKQKVPGTNADLDLQLDWHRRLDTEGLIPKKTHLKVKQQKLDALVAAVEQHNQRVTVKTEEPTNLNKHKVLEQDTGGSSAASDFDVGPGALTDSPSDAIGDLSARLESLYI
ncbi:hypothetical protein BV25DRAFT_1842639 [Artomyces pyxidatus]|uniref:Uncharacterized protein n=1 Tax=Artomyces pyxidatus TaxID=48021 RepID=A0ACB8SI56_9AGAM|nr:hypothetical protein BV25DRAFT_1842639 [Artomyces pyxidatus]